MAGIRERDGLGTVRNELTGEDLNPVWAGEPVGIEAKVHSELRIETNEPRGLNRGRRHPREKAIREATERVLEGEVKGHEGGYVGIVSNDRQSSPAPRKRVFAFLDSELLAALLLCGGLPAVATLAREHPGGWLLVRDVGELAPSPAREPRNRRMNKRLRSEARKGLKKFIQNDSEQTPAPVFLGSGMTSAGAASASYFVTPPPQSSPR